MRALNLLVFDKRNSNDLNRNPTFFEKRRFEKRCSPGNGYDWGDGPFKRGLILRLRKSRKSSLRRKNLSRRDLWTKFSRGPRQRNK